MTTLGNIWPEPTLPEAETEALCAAYANARVILEYGSGGSTMIAAQMTGKRIFSVESDPLWALRLQNRIDSLNLPSPVSIYHADIGVTGNWGRPVNASNWMQFYTYPVAIWDEPFFRSPDVILIDGRFRAACMLISLLRMTHPATILFDDYADRRPYHIVEDFLQPRTLVGRMAIFDAVPGLVQKQDIGKVAEAMTQISFDGEKAFYEKDAAAARKLRLDNRKTQTP